jgi:hypothetical protein
MISVRRYVVTPKDSYPVGIWLTGFLVLKLSGAMGNDRAPNDIKRLAHYMWYVNNNYYQYVEKSR